MRSLNPAFTAPFNPLNRLKPGLVLLCCAAPLSGALLSTGHAATLGDISFSSIAGEHLQASIPVNDIDTATLSSLKVTIGDETLSSAAGLKQSDDLPFLWAELRELTSTSPVVMLLSGEPMPDKHNEIIVELAWTGGSYLREYVVRPPVAGSVSRVATNEGSRNATNSAVDQALNGVVAGASTVTVKRGDTLLSIARNLDPPAGVASGSYTNEQLMLAIYRANPDAFLGSPNRLRAGATLSLPDAAQLRQATQNDASVLFKRPARQSVQAPDSAPQARVVPTVTSQPVPPVENSNKPVTADATSVPISQAVVQPFPEARVDALIDEALTERLEPINTTLTGLSQQIASFERTLVAVDQSIGEQNDAVKAMESRVETLEVSPSKTAVQTVDLRQVSVDTSPQSEQSNALAKESIWTKVAGTPYLRSLGLLALALTLALFLVVKQLLARRESIATDTSAGRKKSDEKTVGGLSRADSKPAVDLVTAGTDTTSALTWFKRHLGSDKVSDDALLEALTRHPQRQDIRMRLLQRYAKRRDVMRFTELGKDMYLMSRGRNPEWPGVLQLALSLESDMTGIGSVNERTMPADLTSLIQESDSLQSANRGRVSGHTDVELA